LDFLEGRGQEVKHIRGQCLLTDLPASSGRHELVEEDDMGPEVIGKAKESFKLGEVASGEGDIDLEV